MAGCPTRLGREKDSLCQPMTMCFRLTNVNISAFWEEKPAINAAYTEARANGLIRNVREDVLAFHTVHPNILHLNSTRIVKRNPTDPFDVTLAELEAREQVFELTAFLKQFDSCKNAVITATPSGIGIRESRMIEGDYTLTQEDLIACTHFEDGIAACNYDIDIHNPKGSGTSHYYFPDGKYYTIPYRRRPRQPHGQDSPYH